MGVTGRYNGILLFIVVRGPALHTGSMITLKSRVSPSSEGIDRGAPSTGSAAETSRSVVICVRLRTRLGVNVEGLPYLCGGSFNSLFSLALRR